MPDATRASSPDPSAARGLDSLRAVLGVGLALLLVIPESEIRQKAFKTHIIVKNLVRPALLTSGDR